MTQHITIQITIKIPSSTEKYLSFAIFYNQLLFIHSDRFIDFCIHQQLVHNWLDKKLI